MARNSLHETETAETLALHALEFLARTDDLLSVFLGASGLSAVDIADSAQDPQFLAAVLDFVLLEDRWVLDFAAQEGIMPGQVAGARALLPGGDLPNWT